MFSALAAGPGPVRKPYVTCGLTNRFRPTFMPLTDSVKWTVYTIGVNAAEPERYYRVLARRYAVNVTKRKVALGKVIARRVLVNCDRRPRVTVSIGSPTHIGDGWDWVCPYKISGLGHPIHDHVHGIDALQALQLVSLGIRKTLENKRCPLAWLGDPFWQSGFPTLLSGLGDPELVRRLETLVQKETTAGRPRRGDG